MQITERLLLIVTAAITTLATLFCLISLATPRWSAGFGLYCSGCPAAPAGLAIIAFLILIAAMIVLILFIIEILPKSLRALTYFILLLATIFTLATHASYFDATTGYSYKLMVFTNFLCYMASCCAAFWLGGTYAATISEPAN